MKKVLIVAMSNKRSIKEKEEINKISEILKNNKIEVILSKYLFDDNTRLKCIELNEYFKRKDIDYIFDISGGDRSILSLKYLELQEVYPTYFGYSDNTVLLTALRKGGLYQLKNMLNSKKEENDILSYILGKNKELLKLEYTFLQGDRLSGIVCGGNIRCFLKLAGTKYMVNTKGKVLLLESFSGDKNLISSYVEQLNLLGVFDNIRGIILGHFTQLEEQGYSAYDIIKEYTDLPIVMTKDIGHNRDSKCIMIGSKIDWRK